MAFLHLLHSFLAITLVAFVGITPLSAADLPSHYVRQTSGSNSVIVFVHGVLGDAQSTWTSGTKYWPSMLADDATFNDADIFVYSYPTSFWATMSVDELAENMRLQMNAYGIPNHQRVVFLAHSMGGLVTRAYLLKNRDVAARTTFAYFYSTPTEGSEVASVATILSLQNPQFGNMMPMDATDYLANLLRQWLAAEYKIPCYCAYEKRKTYWLLIVPFKSASVLCTKPVDPIDADHMGIVKPASPTDAAYLAFKAAYQQEMASVLPSATIVKQLGKVLNKLHQTQMRKDEYLFPAMANYMNDPSEKNWQIVKTTATELLNEINGAVDASIAFDAEFYKEGQNIIWIANGARLTVDRSYYQVFRTSRREWNAYEGLCTSVRRIQI